MCTACVYSWSLELLSVTTYQSNQTQFCKNLVEVGLACETMYIYSCMIFGIWQQLNSDSENVATWKGSADESLTGLSGCNSTQ